MTRSIIHKRLTRSLPNHFMNRARIQDPTIVIDPFGEETTVYVDNPLLINIPCYIEPIRGATSGEDRQPGNTLVTNQWNVILAGHYPQVDNEQQLVIDGISYNIMDVSTEATETITVMVVEKVTL